MLDNENVVASIPRLTGWEYYIGNTFLISTSVLVGWSDSGIRFIKVQTTIHQIDSMSWSAWKGMPELCDALEAAAA